ncbi:DNA-processing protein DprA [Prevotella fusca]|uniref:DNA-processing protein DprA n=1 Tax=Prevotella fusca TaxID=589436 RepID=UPI003F705026
MESLNAILLTRLTRFHLTELAELYRRAGSATAVIEHKRDIREILPDASRHLMQALKDIDNFRDRAEQELEYDQKHNIQLLCMNDERYPQRLRECPDAPILLYYLGNATSTADTSSTLSVRGTVLPTGRTSSIPSPENSRRSAPMYLSSADWHTV